MTIHALQKWVAEDWAYRSKSTPPLELQLLYILEELGEVAEAIRKTSGNKTRTSKEVSIGAKLADLVVSIMTLANAQRVDLTQEIAQFQTRIEARHARGY